MHAREQDTFGDDAESLEASDTDETEDDGEVTAMNEAEVARLFPLVFAAEREQAEAEAEVKRARERVSDLVIQLRGACGSAGPFMVREPASMGGATRRIQIRKRGELAFLVRENDRVLTTIDASGE